MLVEIGAKVARHGRLVTFELAVVAIPRALFAEIQARRRAASGSPAAIMGLDSEASRPPDTRDMARECQGAPSLQEMYGAPAVYTPVTRAAACRFGSIATGASSSLRAVFFSGLSIFLRRSVNSDSSQPSCRRVRFGFFSHEMTVGPHVIRGMSADAKNRCLSVECRLR